MHNLFWPFWDAPFLIPNLRARDYLIIFYSSVELCNLGLGPWIDGADNDLVIFVIIDTSHLVDWLLIGCFGSFS